MSQTGKQIITIHILPDISRSKDNQTMKFGQLLESNMRNIFLKKSYTKCGGETSPRLISQKSKFSISLNQQSKVLHIVFIVCPSLGLPNYSENKVESPCFYLM